MGRFSSFVGVVLLFCVVVAGACVPVGTYRRHQEALTRRIDELERRVEAGDRESARRGAQQAEGLDTLRSRADALDRRSVHASSRLDTHSAWIASLAGRVDGAEADDRARAAAVRARIDRLAAVVLEHAARLRRLERSDARQRELLRTLVAEVQRREAAGAWTPEPVRAVARTGEIGDSATRWAVAEINSGVAANRDSFCYRALRVGVSALPGIVAMFLPGGFLVQLALQVLAAIAGDALGELLSPMITDMCA